MSKKLKISLFTQKIIVFFGFFLAVILFSLSGYYFFSAFKEHSRILNNAQIINKQAEINFKTAGSIASQEAKMKEASKPAQPAFVVPQSAGRSVNVPILTYHYIGNNPNPLDKARDNLSVPPDKFDAQLDHLSKAGYHPITFDTMYAALKGQTGLPSKPIILTFDDGYIDFYVTAFPILKKYGFHAVSFIPTGLMNQGYYMSWSQIKEIDASGLVSFQAHSVNHLNLASLSQDKLVYQLSQSKKTLEGELGKPVNFMAYPYGISDEFVWENAKKAGYLGSVGTYYGTLESEGNIMDMPRIKIAGGWSADDFSKRFP